MFLFEIPIRCILELLISTPLFLHVAFLFFVCYMMHYGFFLRHMLLSINYMCLSAIKFLGSLIVFFYFSTFYSFFHILLFSCNTLYQFDGFDSFFKLLFILNITILQIIILIPQVCMTLILLLFFVLIYLNYAFELFLMHLNCFLKCFHITGSSSWYLCYYCFNWVYIVWLRF